MPELPQGEGPRPARLSARRIALGLAAALVLAIGLGAWFDEPERQDRESRDRIHTAKVELPPLDPGSASIPRGAAVIDLRLDLPDATPGTELRLSWLDRRGGKLRETRHRLEERDEQGRWRFTFFRATLPAWITEVEVTVEDHAPLRFDWPPMR